MPETLPPEPTRLDHVLSHGYSIADPTYAPHTSSKHEFAKLERDGQLYFGKYSLDDSRRQSSIAADIWWCDTIADIDGGQSLAIHSPRVIDHGTGWYVAEWIDGEPSA